MLLARLRSTSVALTRSSFQPRTVAKMLSTGASNTTEKATAERHDIVLGTYAPFCKHLFIENFTGARLNIVPITQANAPMLMSDYEARTEYELPVLSRWFPSHSVTPRVAEYLDIILYSRDQIVKENEAVEVQADPSHSQSPWGIVSIKAQDVDHELPMKPITMMRNAIGKAQGGSGVPIDRDEYMKAVEYWKTHAVIKKM
uniref:Uncharacterized protein n=1 Tax=Hyaloperonospora arabidopsidis (strain Emoy2) TaxID=559515 RepID=M4BBJ7_HYAAE